MQLLSLWGFLSDEWTRMSCVQCIGLCQVHILSQFLGDYVTYYLQYNMHTRAFSVQAALQSQCY